MPTVEKTILIKSTHGIHTELATKIVQCASDYTVDINLHYKNKVVSVKSILGLMSLAVPFGENVKLVASGNDADKVISEISKLLGE